MVLKYRREVSAGLRIFRIFLGIIMITFGYVFLSILKESFSTYLVLGSIIFSVIGFISSVMILLSFTEPSYIVTVVSKNKKIFWVRKLPFLGTKRTSYSFNDIKYVDLIRASGDDSGTSIILHLKKKNVLLMDELDHAKVQKEYTKLLNLGLPNKDLFKSS